MALISNMQCYDVQINCENAQEDRLNLEILKRKGDDKFKQISFCTSIQAIYRRRTKN